MSSRMVEEVEGARARDLTGLDPSQYSSSRETDALTPQILQGWWVDDSGPPRPPRRHRVIRPNRVLAYSPLKAQVPDSCMQDRSGSISWSHPKSHEAVVSNRPRGWSARQDD
jgi:hypothetical protein